MVSRGPQEKQKELLAVDASNEAFSTPVMMVL